MSNIAFVTQVEQTALEANGATLTVTPTSNFTVDQTSTNSGAYNESNKFVVSGTVVANKSTKIATLKVSFSDTNAKMFTKSPYVIGSSSLKIKIAKRNFTGKNTRTKGYITSYDIDLFYKNNAATALQDLSSNSIRIYFKQVNVVKNYHKDDRDVTGRLTSFSFGRPELSIFGEERNIKIEGLPGTSFTLSITNDDFESILSEQTGVNSSYYKPASDIGTYTLSNGNVVRAIVASIPKSGVYICKQKFPSSLFNAQATETNSGATKIKLTDASGIKHDDILYSELSDYADIQNNIGTSGLTKKKVSVINPDGDDENEITITGGTITNTSINYPITFNRQSNFKIICVTDAQHYSSTGVFNTEHTITQNLDPILNFTIDVPADTTLSRLCVAKSLSALNTSSFVTTSFSAGDDLTVSLRGKHNYDTETGRTVNFVYFKFLITGPSNIQTTTPPTLETFYDRQIDTSGCVIRMVHSNWVDISSHNATLELGFHIIRYGVSDKTITLDLDNYFTHA